MLFLYFLLIYIFFSYCLGRENPVCFLRDSHFVYLLEILLLLCKNLIAEHK